MERTETLQKRKTPSKEASDRLRNPSKKTEQTTSTGIANQFNMPITKLNELERHSFNIKRT